MSSQCAEPKLPSNHPIIVGVPAACELQNAPCRSSTALVVLTSTMMSIHKDQLRT